jgi:hypothetical protein
MELKRNHCQRYVTDRYGKPIAVADKMKYPTMEKAQLAADEQNLLLSRKEKIVPYHCSVCKQYHVGRNGEGLTQDDVDEIWERTKPVEYRMPEVKVIGKIDVTTIEKKTKSKKSLKALNGRQNTIDNSYDKGVERKDMTSEKQKIWSVLDGRRRVAWVFLTLAEKDAVKLAKNSSAIGIMKMYPDLESEAAKKRIDSIGGHKEHVAGEALVYRKGYENQAKAVREMLLSKGGSWKYEDAEEDIAFLRLLGYSKGCIQKHIKGTYPHFDGDEYRRQNDRREFLKSINGPDEEIERQRKEILEAEENEK